MATIQRLKPTRADAERAVRTLLAWTGDDPDREGLRETPARVTRAYEEWFQGYDQDPEQMLRQTFGEVAGYDEMVTLRDIPFESFCEHHLAPIIGCVHIGYLPNGRVVGISKLARVVDAFAKRLQIQERLTAEIADVLNEVLRPAGVGGRHGVHKHGVSMLTSRMLGAFRDNPATRQEFMDGLNLK